MGDRDEAFARRLRAKAEQYGMYVEGMADLPADDSQRELFKARLRLARNRRRYHAADRAPARPARRDFESLDQFHALELRGAAIAGAGRAAGREAPRAAGDREPQDPPGRRAVDLLRRLGSPQVGSCVDTGNNLALLEDPLETVRTLARPPSPCT